MESFKVLELAARVVILASGGTNPPGNLITVARNFIGLLHH
jgi:hypothetical protein